MSGLRVVDYAPRHAAAFRDLNRSWIEEHFELEERDRRQIFGSEAAILAPGGAILLAEQDGVPVGCCALVRQEPGVYELSKMAVDRQLRGHGIGRVLLEHAIRRARALGAARLTILSNTVLAPAIHLYRQHGFAEVPLRSREYARANIALELTLGSG
jgi:GNAT superfamily N-acetyltransferase